MKFLICFVWSLALLTGCSAATEKSKPSHPTEKISVSLLDPQNFKDNEVFQHMVKIINQNTQALNERNEQKFLQTFSSKIENAQKLAKSTYDYWANEEELRVVKLSNPVMEINPASTIVWVTKEVYSKNSKEIQYPTSAYIFQFEDNIWQLAFID